MNQTAEISEAVKAQAPNCIEVEQTLLGTLLANNASYVGCSWLTPADFFEGLHARIFEALQNCLAADGKYTPMMAMAQFRDDGTLAAMGIPASQYMAGLVSSQDAANTVPWLAKMIRNDSMRRRIADEAGKVIEAALNPEPGKTALDLSLSAIDVFTAIGRDVAGGGSREAQPIVKIAVGITDRLNDALMNGVVHDGFAYAGSKTLSEAIGGWRRGRFYVIGGRPGMGKTTVGLSWLLRTAGKNYGVAFFSLEMGADELTERALSDLSYVQGGGVQYQTIARNEVNAKGLERLFDAQRVMNDLPLYIDDRAGLTLAQIRAAAQQQKQRLEARGLRLDVVCIDHMGLVRASERYAGNKVAETEEISAALKVMAKELDCAVIALMQLNRGVEGREVKRPTLADLRWSGAIEQDADCVMFCYRESYYLERDRKDDMADEQERLDKLAQVKDRLEIIVAKQRGGSCPTLDFHCDMGCSAARDIQ